MVSALSSPGSAVLGRLRLGLLFLGRLVVGSGRRLSTADRAAHPLPQLGRLVNAHPRTVQRVLLRMSASASQDHQTSSASLKKSGSPPKALKASRSSARLISASTLRPSPLLTVTRMVHSSGSASVSRISADSHSTARLSAVSASTMGFVSIFTSYQVRMT